MKRAGAPFGQKSTTALDSQQQPPHYVLVCSFTFTIFWLPHPSSAPPGLANAAYCYVHSPRRPWLRKVNTYVVVFFYRKTYVVVELTRVINTAIYKVLSIHVDIFEYTSLQQKKLIIEQDMCTKTNICVYILLNLRGLLFKVKTILKE